MKTKALFLGALLFLIVTNNVFSQVITDNGYFVLNSGEKVNAQILVEVKHKMPKNFKYIRDGKTLTVPSSDIKELSVRNLKYIRKIVQLDVSSNLNNISIGKEPSYESKSLLLRVLLEGEVGLYVYESEEYYQFFLMKDAKIIPLIYKKYKADGKIKKNKSFRNQIAKLSTCNSKLSKLKYKERNLKKFFKTELECQNKKYTDLSKQPFTYKEIINITPRIGYQTNNGIYGATEFPGVISTDFSASSISYGIEGEVLLPFLNRNFSAVAGLDFMNINEVNIYTNNGSPQYSGNISHDYNVIEFFTGIRYHYAIDTSNSVFVGLRYKNSSRNGTTTFDFNPNFNIGQSKVDMGDYDSFGFSFGYKYKKISLLFTYDRYNINTLVDPNNSIEFWAYRDVNNLHVKIGYDLF